MTAPARTAVLAALAVVLSGCAVPAWVPFLGKKPEPPRAERPAGARRPAPAAEPAASEPAATATPPETAAPPAPVDERVADRVIAVVNNDAVTLSELQESIAMYRLENRGETRSDDELARQILNRFIDRRLQLHEAEREKVLVEDVEIEEELAERMRKFGANTKEEFEALLKRQGLSVEVARKTVRDALKVQKVVRRKVALRVSVTDQEITAYLDANRAKLETGLAYHARHILVQPEGGASDAAWEAARIRAEMLRAQILEGADFAEMARQHSRDASAKDGGDLGTLKRGELTQEIETAILALAPGEISRPFRSPLGYHIFRLESKETLEGEGLVRVRQQIRDILYRQKYEARFDAWLKEVKARAVIEVRL